MDDATMADHVATTTAAGGGAGADPEPGLRQALAEMVERELEWMVADHGTGGIFSMFELEMRRR